MKHLLYLVFLVVGTINAQIENKAAATKRTLILGAFIHIGNGITFENGALGMVGSKITVVKNALTYTVNRSEWDTIIQANGKHIYPGFVAPNSTLGLTEIDAVRATRDFDEVGYINPHVRSQIAFNTESKVVAATRTNGVLVTQSTPRGGLISGQSSLMHLFGWTWEDATIKANDGIHLNWPTLVMRKWNGESVDKSPSTSYHKDKANLIDFFKQAKAYLNSDTKSKQDIRFEACRNLFEGETRLYISVNELQEILDVVDFVKELAIKKPVIVGGYDAWRAAQVLKEYKIPVMLARVHSLPLRENDPIDLPFRLPYLLQQAGVQFCLQNEGDMEAMNARNIPFLAGTAMAYGLTEEQAIESVTYSSCKIMGIDKTHGSLEEGKTATLFISTGSALDMKTHNVEYFFINGEFLLPVNTQTDLKNKYEGKYKR
jgi:imidazolonepropionase-like amidohydrolase